MNRERAWMLTERVISMPSLRGAVDVRFAELMEGVICFGSIGSGKTSGPGTAFPEAMLARGCGLLALCAKVDEAERVAEIAARAGRESDVVRFASGWAAAYNFLADLADGGSSAVVNGFAQVSEAISGRVDRTEWVAAAESHLRMGVEAFLLSGRALQLLDLRMFLNSLRQQEELLRQSDLGRSPAAMLVANYFEETWCSMSEKTRASVLMSLNPALDAFAIGPLHSLFCTTTTVRPYDLRRGKIIIIDIPILGDDAVSARAAGIIWKFMAQRCLQKDFGEEGKISADDGTRPVVIMADEAHFFTTSGDALFQTTARASRVITFYLSQTINNFWACLGGNARARIQTGVLLDTLQGVRLMAQTGSDDTIAWFNRVMGKELQIREGRSVGIGSSTSGGASTSVVRDVVLESRDFQVLAKGGAGFRYCVSVIILMAGRVFQGGRLWTQVAFPQRRRSL